VIEEVLTWLKSEALKSGLDVNANKTKDKRAMRSLPNLRQRFECKQSCF
jgi:hypothetical protein